MTARILRGVVKVVGRKKAVAVPTYTLTSTTINPHAMSETVVLETSLGEIQLEMYSKHAPKVCVRYY